MEPATGTLPGQQNVSGFQGKHLVNSFLNGDDTTGKLTSQPFTVERTYINFLVGGGSRAGQTCVNLVVDGAVVRTATGQEKERLDWASWDVRDLQGKQAHIEIVDNAKGGWGHINVDNIVFSDTPPAPPHSACRTGRLWLYGAGPARRQRRAPLRKHICLTPPCRMLFSPHQRQTRRARHSLSAAN